MKQFKFFIAGTLLTALTFPIPQVTAGQLTGTTALACEAILCLSSGVRPGECSPSLSHYFGIKKRKWSDTVSARLDFLSMCPVVSEAGMPSLVNAIARGAGRCDAEYLNQQLRDPDSGIVSSSKPAHCVTYENHEWTIDMATKYVGTPTKGGYWVEEENYEGALAEWEQKQAELERLRAGHEDSRRSRFAH